IKDLTDRLFVNWDILETKEEYDIMRKYAEKGRWYALIYGSFSYVTNIIFATTSLVPRVLDIVFPLNISRPIMLPIPAYYFVDENKYFYYIFLHMLIAGNVCLTGLIAHARMFFVYVEHVCGLFAVVGFRFEHVSHKRSAMEKNMINYPDVSQTMYHKNIVISISAHRKALQFAQFLEHIFTISLAMQLLIVTIGLSITLVQVSDLLIDSKYENFIMLAKFAYQFMCKTNVQCICEAMTSYLLTCTSLLKMYTCQLNIRTIKSLTQHLFTDWKGLKTSEEYEIMKLYAENSRRFCVAYTVYCMLAVTTFMSLSLVPFALDAVWPLNESRPIVPPYPGYYFVELREYFYKIFCHSIIVWEITIIGIIAHDCMFVTFVEHVCSMLALVGFYFENLFNKGDETMKIANNSNDTYRERIAFFINKHQDALNAEEYEIMKKYATNAKLITLAYFCKDKSLFIILILTNYGRLFHFVAVHILLCLCMFLLISLMPTLLNIVSPLNESRPIIMPYSAYYFVDEEKYYFYIMFHITTCLTIALLALLAHDCVLFIYIEHVCSLFAVIGYNSSWYKIPVESQKLLLHVMRRSMEPCFLSAGKIYVFSLKSFTTVAQFFLCDGNARCIKLTIPMFLLMITFLVKLSTWQFNSSKIKSLTDHIYDDWEMFNSVEEYEIMKKYATNAKLISMTYFILCLCVCQGYTLFSFMPKLLNIVLPLNESRPVNIPYQAYYFVDEEKYYFYILFHIIGCGFICVMMTVGLDCTFFIYIEHVCSLFALTG
ncbi:hypothetical protein ALC56_07931, partial [Trachymyrmex septentrionalis]